MRSRVLICVMASSLVYACGSTVVPRDTLYQISLASALVEKDYDGDVTLWELLRHGNFGLGTFSGLDGEMVVLDGVVYRVKGDGTVERPELDETTPFAAVTQFRTDSQVSIDHEIDLDELEKLIDVSLDNPNIFYALRIQTRVNRITLRSVDRQTKPYRELVDVAQGQNTWTHEDIKGTLVGLRMPSYVGSMSLAGYHWHFISSDKEVGGHVLEAIVDRDVVDIDHVHHWDVALPERESFGTLDLDTDRTRELEIVEK